MGPLQGRVLFLNRRHRFFPLGVFILGLALTGLGAAGVKLRRENHAFEVHQLLASERLESSKERLRSVFSLTYEAIRTMAMLPGVGRVDLHAKKFNEDAETSIQQLYNNVAAHIDVSEIYFVMDGFDPDRTDPVTGKLMEPMITFDRMITGKSAEKMGEKGDALEEVEIYEYREMKKQIAWFRKHHPNVKSISGLNYPALSSPEVITCDNREFTRADLARGENHGRSGIVYSIPFYGSDGKFRGIVAAVLRSLVLERAMNLPGAVLEGSGSGFRVGSISESNTHHPFSVFQKSEIAVQDLSPWTISYFVSGEDFLNERAQSLIIRDVLFVCLTGILVSLLLTWAIFLLNSTRVKAEALAQEMLEVAQEQQAALVNASKMASLGEMASGLAHEINNPLAIILGRAFLLKRSLQNSKIDPEAMALEVEKITITTQRIATIIKGLRTFSRDAEGDAFSRVSIKDIINETLGFCVEKYKAHGVELQVVEIPNIELEARSAQISQVILNLLNNSLDALEPLTEKWVRLEVSLFDSENLQISITDSGKGISSEIAEKITQPFFTTKEVGKGTGLGLSISRGIIEKHGGTLTLDSSSPNTRFVIRLKLNPKVVSTPGAA